MATTSPTMNKIERAHQMYRDGKHLQALGFYTEALSLAKTKSQNIALHSNRAACYLKLHDFEKAAKECTSVLELDHDHTGALMLRAQTLVTLKEYQSALFDVNRLIELNPSSEIYENLQARLKTQLSLAPIPESEAELEVEEEEEEDEVNMIKEAEPISDKTEKKANHVNPVVQRDHRVESGMDLANTKVSVPTPDSSLSEGDVFLTQIQKTSPDQHSNGWTTIPKPKGHSNLDYSRWDQVEDDSSEDDEDDSADESEPQYRFRVKTIGVRPVK